MKATLATICALFLTVALWRVSTVQAADGDNEAAEFYERALVAHNLGEPRTAYIYLRNALREDPFLLPAHLLLGKIYLSLGQGESAEKQLMIADGLGAHRSLIQNSLARAYLLQGKAKQVIEELFPIGTAPEEDAELLALRGEAHLELGELFDAQRAFTQAWEKNPRSVGALLGRIQVMLRRGEVGDAVEYAERAVQLAPGNPRAWYLKGLLARALGDLNGALKDFERATEGLPAYMPAQISRIGVLSELGRFAEALEVAAVIQEHYPNDPRSYYLEAVLQGRLKNEDAADEALSRAANLISSFPKELVEGHSPTLLLAGMISYDLKQWELATSYLQVYLAQHPDSVGARIMLGRIMLDQKKNQTAISYLEPAVKIAPDSVRALSLLAEAYMRESEHLKASTLLQQVADRDSDVVLRTQAAVNAFGLGRRGKAIEQLDEILAERPDLNTAGATLVVMQLHEKMYQQALKSAKAMVLESPENLTFVNLLGVAELAAGNQDAAAWAYEVALMLDEDFSTATLNLAELDLERNHPESAAERLELMLERDEDNITALMLLARAREAQGDLDQAIKLARRALGVDSSSVRVAIYLTEQLLKARDPNEAVAVAESMEVRAANPDDSLLLAALSRAYIASGRRATAQVVLRRSSSLAGYSARRLLQIAELQRDAGDLEGAIWSLQKAVEGEPDYLPARMKLGELFALVDRETDAEDVAIALIKQYPDEPYGFHLQGVIQQQLGNHESALSAYRAALARRASPVLVLRVYEEKRQVDGDGPALEFLQQWVDAKPGEPLVTQTLAEALLRNGRTREAIERFEMALKQSPENALVLNNLAIAYAQVGDKRALETARAAFRKLPTAPQVADTLGWILVLGGDVENGLKHLRDAQSRAPSDPTVSYHIAVALEQLDRRPEAIVELEAATNSPNDSFLERGKAEALLAKLREQARAEDEVKGVVRPPATTDVDEG